MSSTTGAFKGSNPDDFYRTPAATTRLILPHLAEPEIVLDPCAGDGAILDVVRDELPNATHYGFELDPARAAKSGSYVGDALTRGDWRHPALRPAHAPDLILANFPFTLAMPFLLKSLAEVAPGGDVAVLLRLAFLASAERRDFHRAHPCDVFVLHQRPSFAASLKCKNRRGAPLQRPPACLWKLMLPIDEPRPKVCPVCGAGVDCTTSDSADYAWMVWGAGRGGRITIL